MIDVTKIDQVYDHQAANHPWSALKQQVSKTPLAALGLAAGAGWLAYKLLTPARPPKKFRATARALTKQVKRSSASRTLKSMAGSLALSYLNRKLHNKLRWR